MVSDTRLVILLPLKTKLVALDNTIKISCAFVQQYRNQRLFPSRSVKIVFGVHNRDHPFVCTIVVFCQYFVNVSLQRRYTSTPWQFFNSLVIFCGCFKRNETFEIYSIETIGDVNRVNNVFLWNFYQDRSGPLTRLVSHLDHLDATLKEDSNIEQLL